MRQFFGLFVLVSLVFLGCGGDATEKRAPLPVQSNEKEPGSSGSEYASDEGSSREYAYSKILDGLTILPRIYAEDITSKQKLVKTADITIEVLDFKLADKKIRELAIYKASYIASENETNYNLQMKNEMTIRVQSESFDSLTARILAISEFVHLKKITVDDVTDAFFDVQNRLETKKKVEVRYLEILKTARTVPDILAVEKELRVLQEEIDATEGKLRLLSDQISFSTIRLIFYQTLESVKTNHPGFLKRVWDSIESGWFGLIFLVIELFRLWPFLLIVTGTIYFILRRKRKKRVL